MYDPARLLVDLIGEREEHGWLEVRWAPKGQNMRREFYRCTETGHERAARDAVRYGRYGDVFIGCAPRDKQGKGGKENISHSWCLWADCDTPEAVRALANFRPLPSLVIRSGSPGNLHAWWGLEHAVPSRYVELVNRRLAHALGADPKCAEVARILRVPLTRNYKYDPPRAVELIAPDPDYWTVRDTARYGLLDFAHLDDPPEPRRETVTAPRVASDDPLRGISAVEYVRRLTGREVNAKGFVQCPFHKGGQERTPSFVAYADPGAGWHCFGCGEGGDIYSFGARLWALSTRGPDFVRIRERLTEALL